MKRLTLKEPVTIVGSSALALGTLTKLPSEPSNLSPSVLGPFAREQGIELRPISLEEIQKTRYKNGMGWYWETKDGTFVPIDLSLIHETKIKCERTAQIKLNGLLHYLYLQRGDEKLHCVEHLLFLKALGMDGVVIKAIGDSTWVPYDGRSKMLWEAVEDHLIENGDLKPMPLPLHETYEVPEKKFGWKRGISLDGTKEKDCLVVKVTLDYKRYGGKTTIERRFTDPLEMEDVLFSRTLLAQPIVTEMFPFFKAIGWPHMENIQRQREFDPQNPKPYVNNMALHRTLDFAGAMSIMAEAGTCITGHLHSDKGNHKSDLLFLQKVKASARAMYPHLESLASDDKSILSTPDSHWRTIISRKFNQPSIRKF